MGENIQINISMTSHLILTIGSFIFQNAANVAPVRPLNIICVLDMGSANMVTFIMISALDMSAQPRERKPVDIKSGLSKIFWYLNVSDTV